MSNFQNFAPTRRLSKTRSKPAKAIGEHDVLAEVLDEARRDIKDQKLPPKPEPGTLDIKQVLDAEFAFA